MKVLLKIPQMMGGTSQFFTVKFLGVFFSIGFLRGGCSRGGGNWGSLRIPREDWGSSGNVRED